MTADDNKYFFNIVYHVIFSDLSVFEEVQGDLYILQLVEAHPSFLPRLEETRERHRTSGGGLAGTHEV